MFYSATNFNNGGNALTWSSGTGTSKVTIMHSMFRNAPAFNQNIGGWNVSAVTNMQHMFYQATVFNQNIGGWNVSAVTLMTNMFNQCKCIIRCK